MSRTIKFRAWGPVSKSMMSWDDIRPNLSLAFEQAKRGAIILMQFTSLKDKNGKEIYDGDIVYSRSNGVGLIQWDERNATYSSVGKTADMTLAVIRRECEVIGNIYENPQLLNSQ